MHDNQARCPVCASARYRKIYRVKSHHRRDLRSEITIAKCAECGTAYLGDAEHSFQEDLYAYYEQFSGKTMEELVSPLTLASYRRVFSKLRKHCALQSILDVGCGKGEFVWAALGQGYAIEGLELSAEAVAFARSLALPVRHQSLFSSELDCRLWSAITMFEVLEHVDKPAAMIKRATDLLEPGGLLYLTTPNFNSLDRLGLGSRWHVFHPEHITYFSTRGLTQLIRSQEPRLQLVSVESNNVSPQLVGRAFELINGLFESRELKNRELNGQIRRSTLDLRSLSEGTRFTRAAKRVINQALSLLGMGATTIITAKKVKS
jgi:2-polyprenyl-3-methyl-5-hydroxy-6-metoxy-1,4-benzoquinol methylase